MDHCNPLGEAATGMMEVESINEAAVAAELQRVFGENPTASDGERCPVSLNVEDPLSEGGADNENSWTYYFRSLTITVGKSKEMVEKGYFVEGEAHPLGAKTVLEPDNNVAMVYKDFFIAGLCMPPHPALADILLHFQAQLHQLTPNSITLSKYFWVIGSFGGVASGSASAKRYDLHYQLKTVETPEGGSNCTIRMPEFPC
jgi:hypothetical protein